MAEGIRTETVEPTDAAIAAREMAEAGAEQDWSALAQNLQSDRGDERQAAADDLNFYRGLFDRMEGKAKVRFPPIVTDWAKVPHPEREWLIKGWMPRGRIGMLSGTGGAGKSLLCIQLGAAFASGDPLWLGHGGTNVYAGASDEPAKVLYAGYEDEKEEIARRLAWVGKAWHDEKKPAEIFGRISSRFGYVEMGAVGPVWAVPEGTTRHGRATLTPTGAELRRRCEDVGARLLIIDPLAAAYGADENDNAAAAEFISHWAEWAHKADCAVLLVHHLPKSEAKNDDEGTGYRGASAWQGGVRFMWKLTGAALRSLKSSYAAQPKPLALERNETTHWTWKLANDQTVFAGDGSTEGTAELMGGPLSGERVTNDQLHSLRRVDFVQSNSASATANGKKAAKEEWEAVLGVRTLKLNHRGELGI